MQADPQITTLAQTIQFSLAPVFLLSGVAALLNVLHGRLSRVIDRTRFLEAETTDPVGVAGELSVLMVRRHWINRSITYCTICAVLVAGVVALLFVGAMVHYDVSRIVAGAFIAAMVALIIALLSFLREVNLAVRYFRRVVAPR